MSDRKRASAELRSELASAEPSQTELSQTELSQTELIESDIGRYLDLYQSKELLRFVAVGSVDDGKSTLIGRLLHDAGGVYDDQLAAARAATQLDGEEIDFSLLTDGLRAEREQGITIDVAYRYFATSHRKFIIADTPGHVQYTRNMVTGASTADLAIILVDARLGVLEQTRRHAYIAALLGISHFAVCVNKMDLVGYDRDVYERICRNLSEVTKSLPFKSVQYFPISALRGANVVRRDERMAWYDGPTVMDYLETVPIEFARKADGFRLPVQCVIRPNLDYRGFAGQIASGIIRPGDEVMVLPSGVRSSVRAVDTYDGELDQGQAPQSVCLRLSEEVDCSRGDMIVRMADQHMPMVTRAFTADLVWMAETPLDRAKTYLLKHTTQVVRAEIDAVESRMDLRKLRGEPAETLALNDIGRVSMRVHRAIYVDSYDENRSTGAFILVDSLTNNTVAAGMIRSSTKREQALGEALKEARAGSALRPHTQVSPAERAARMGQRGCVVWLVGRPGSGRWPLAYALERRLFDDGRTATVIDPTGMTLQSMVAAARACREAGLVTVCAFPTYERRDRKLLRETFGDDGLTVVYVNTDERLCRERRPDADHEKFQAPQHPELTLALEHMSAESASSTIIHYLRTQGRLS